MRRAAPTPLPEASASTNADVARAQGQEVVEISAHRAGLKTETRVVEGGEGRLRAREQLGLHAPRHREVAGAARVRGGALPPLRLAQLGRDQLLERPVVPGLENEAARALTHRFDRQLDAAPRGHHDHGRQGMSLAQPAQEVNTLGARGRVAGVVEVHEHEVGAPAHGLEQGGGGAHVLDRMTLGLEEQAQGQAHVGLVVGHDDAGFLHATSGSRAAARPGMSFSLERTVPTPRAPVACGGATTWRSRGTPLPPLLFEPGNPRLGTGRFRMIPPRAAL